MPGSSANYGKFQSYHNLLSLSESSKTADLKPRRNRRTRNSARNEDTDIVARCLLDTMYSFFNHSCQVPCMVSVDDRKRNPDAFLAMVDIREGQAVFNSYLPAPALGVLNKSQRQEMLEEMLDGPCKCTRCQSETR